MITNVNTGLCHSRAQQGQPAFFVNWQVNGAQHYRFFAMRFAAETYYQSLLNNQN